MTPSKRMSSMVRVMKNHGWVVDQKASTAGTYRVWMKARQVIMDDPVAHATLAESIILRLEDVEVVGGYLGDVKNFDHWIISPDKDWSISMQNYNTGFVCLTSVRSGKAGEAVKNGYDA